MRVAVLGAGAPAGVNTLRALHSAGHECVAIDDNEAHLVYCEPYAETRTTWDFSDVDVALPQPENLVLRACELTDVATLLPSPEVVETCQDKGQTARRWYLDRLRELPALSVEEPWADHLHQARDKFGLPFWLRSARGAGAKAAICVRQLDQAYHWIRFWQSRDTDIEWIAEEYLPGRDLAWSSVWCDGHLVTSFARERLEYLYPHLTPEGLTGTPTVARVVVEEAVNDAACAAVMSVDPEPNGIYSVDLREDSNGLPRPTEINAGRGFTTFGLWSLYGINFFDIVVKLAVGIHVDAPQYDALPDGLTLSRHIDCEHTFTMEPCLTSS